MIGHNHKENRGDSPAYWLTTKCSKNTRWQTFNKRYTAYDPKCFECRLLELIINIKWMDDKAKGAYEI